MYIVPYTRRLEQNSLLGVRPVNGDAENCRRLGHTEGAVTSKPTPVRQCLRLWMTMSNTMREYVSARQILAPPLGSRFDMTLQRYASIGDEHRPHGVKNVRWRTYAS